jgi:hypothetical protein
MSKSAPAPLTIPGLPKKGEAAPVVASIEAASTTATLQAQEPPPALTDMSAAVPAPPPLPASSRVRPTIAVTVRLDEIRYERLKRFGGKHRITNQDIIVAALDHFLQGRE